MAGNCAKPGESWTKVDRASSGARSEAMERMRRVWSEPSPKEANDLAWHYPEVADLLDDEVGGKMELWLAKGLLSKSLDRRVLMEAAAREFCQHASVKGEIFTFNLEQGFLLFRFQEKGEHDSMLLRPWMVFG